MSLEDTLIQDMHGPMVVRGLAGQMVVVVVVIMVVPPIGLTVVGDPILSNQVQVILL
jgi:hypothetical protein